VPQVMGANCADHDHWRGVADSRGAPGRARAVISGAAQAGSPDSRRRPGRHRAANTLTDEITLSSSQLS
jgi:hypothetical protein